MIELLRIVLVVYLVVAVPIAVLFMFPPASVPAELRFTPWQAIWHALRWPMGLGPMLLGLREGIRAAQRDDSQDYLQWRLLDRNRGQLMTERTVCAGPHDWWEHEDRKWCRYCYRTPDELAAGAAAAVDTRAAVPR